ncbi:MAG TPA: Na+/H+ antiporter, partial [Candidatus Acidoferrum sp.]
MPTGGFERIEPVLLLLLLFVVGLAALAKRLEIPYPIVLVIGGVILSFIPRVPRIELSSNVVFLLILPPLVFSAATLTSWRDFRRNLRIISMLALGLVAFTVWGVAGLSQWILPDFNWNLGLVLGAVVCTTDAIAATAIARRLGLPRRLVDVLEGESLVNDASGLLALQLATRRILTGQRLGLGGRVELLAYLVGSGIVIGLVLGKIVRVMVRRIDAAPLEITFGLIAPYIAYLTAESLHSSGVLATVVCGLYLGHTSSTYLSIGARLQSTAVWETFTFVLNGVVFILIGLQLPYILQGIPTIGLGQLIVHGLELSAIVVLLRMMWIFPGASISNWIQTRIRHRHDPAPSPKALFAVGWAGMRGVVALAAAISLPETLKNGSPFPQRNVIIFLTYCVIFVTLVLQGLTLPPLLRFLGLAGASGVNREEVNARREMIEAA